MYKLVTKIKELYKYIEVFKKYNNTKIYYKGRYF